MSEKARWRGLSALVRDLLVNGSQAVETIQLATVHRPVAILTRVAPHTPVAAAAEVVEKLHALGVTVTHAGIRGVVRLIDRGVEASLGLAGGGPERKA
jgi:hypothetical protein